MNAGSPERNGKIERFSANLGNVKEEAVFEHSIEAWNQCPHASFEQMRHPRGQGN
jgi:hypothetical protein